jgi:hypothetical protein
MRHTSHISPSHSDTTTSNGSAWNIEHAALVERLGYGVAASTDESGQININWLIMHIWLAQCELIHTAKLSATSAEDPTKSFIASMNALRKSFPIALSQAIPLFAEYADPVMIREWRNDDQVIGIITDEAFFLKAEQVGLPVTSSDLMWALGVDSGERGPRRPIVANNSAPRLH